ncbi:MAG: hypothetical protein RL662_2209 [Bacteroidota bacterium]|jgi:hypothetical protein
MDTKHHNRYRALLEQLSYRYNGYDLKELIPGYCTFAFDDNSLSARDVFKAFYLTTKPYNLAQVFEVSTPTIITYLINRHDYRELAVAAQGDYSDSEVVNIESLPKRKSSPLRLSYIKNLSKAIRIVFLRSIAESLLTKLYLVALITKIFNDVHHIEKATPPKNVMRYICFNTAYKEESLLTLYFKKRGIETMTLQHGIFCDFKQVIPFDCINFENLIADKVLCWGQSTVDYLVSKNINQERLILMGNPKYGGIDIEHVDQSFTKCLVLLGRQIYIQSNEKLLSVLQEFNQKHNNKILFYLKKHPFLMDSDHKSFASIANNMLFVGKEHSVQEIMKSDLVNFSIAVNTTAYYESLALGKVSLRWSEAENEDFVGLDDKFSDLKELELKLNEFASRPEPEIRKEMKDVIRYVFNPNLQ